MKAVYPSRADLPNEAIEIIRNYDWYISCLWKNKIIIKH
jgi:hypothetical protein